MRRGERGIHHISPQRSNCGSGVKASAKNSPLVDVAQFRFGLLGRTVYSHVYSRGLFSASGVSKLHDFNMMP